MHTHSPFNGRNALQLVSLKTGTVKGQSINCDQAIRTGKLAIANMVGKSFHKVKLYRTDPVRSLSSMSNTITISGEKLFVNTTLLFNRITYVLKSSFAMQRYFLKSSFAMQRYLHWELAQQPPALFESGVLMRKTQKYVLGSAISY